MIKIIQPDMTLLEIIVNDDGTVDSVISGSGIKLIDGIASVMIENPIVREILISSVKEYELRENQ